MRGASVAGDVFETTSLLRNAERIHSALGDVPSAVYGRTTAVARGVGDGAETETVAAGGTRNLDLAERTGARQAGIMPVGGPIWMHAEPKAVINLIDRGLAPVAVASNWKFCTVCEAWLKDLGAVISEEGSNVP